MKAIISIFLFIIFTSCSEHEIQPVNIASRDSLTLDLQKKIAEKKQLEEFRQEFERRGYMKSIAKYKAVLI